MITIDSAVMDDLDLPRYLQLATVLRGRIDDGTYVVGRRIPSEVALVQETGYARETVRRAIAVLVAEKRVRAVHGIGTFVEPGPYADPTPWPPEASDPTGR
jgi:GntR family transcriptional regulator